jgi:hypothetical protein
MRAYCPDFFMGSRYYNQYSAGDNNPQVTNINRYTKRYYGVTRYSSTALEELNELSREIQNKYNKKKLTPQSYKPQFQTPQPLYPAPIKKLESPTPFDLDEELVELKPQKTKKTAKPKKQSIPALQPEQRPELEKFYGEKWSFDTGFLKNSFWHTIVLIALIPLINSCFINLFALSTNINKNFKLSLKENQLQKDRSEIKGKIEEYHSHSGMKRTIKQEIKVIEKNEILIKLL